MEQCQDISDRSDAIPPPRGLAPAREPWLRIAPEDIPEYPLAGEPGHGRTASIRRQPARVVAGRIEGGYTDAFELICPDCGDNPYLDYSEIPPRLQHLRGPHALLVALTAYAKHLGM